MSIVFKITDPNVYKPMIEGANTVDDIIGAFNRLFDMNIDALMVKRVPKFKAAYQEFKGTTDFMRKFTLAQRIRPNNSVFNHELDTMVSMAGMDPMEVRFDLDQVPDVTRIGAKAKDHFTATGEAGHKDLDVSDLFQQRAKTNQELKWVDDEYRRLSTKVKDLFKKEGDEITAQYREANEDYSRAYHKLVRLNSGDPDYMENEKKLGAECDLARKKQRELIAQDQALAKKMVLELKPYQDLKAEARERLKKEAAGYQNEFKDRTLETVLQSTPISETQATEWAKNQDIPKNAERRMKKAGYAIEDVRKDMAEFYRLVGGRLPKCKVITEGRRRACAKLKDYAVSIDSRFDKRTLFHEMAHLLETDIRLKAMSQRFLMSRAKPGSRPVLLKRLDPKRRWDRGESAFVDNFFDVYAGKYYQDGVTEVLSMGVQMFSSPALMMDLYDKDREMFSMVYGMLLNPPGENELSEILEKSDAVTDEINRNKIFFEALNSRIKTQSVFEKHADKVSFDTYTKFRGKRPSFWFVYVGDDRERYDFKSKKAAFQFAYLYLLKPEELYVNERAVRDQEAPEWYKTGDPLPEA